MKRIILSIVILLSQQLYSQGLTLSAGYLAYNDSKDLYIGNVFGGVVDVDFKTKDFRGILGLGVLSGKIYPIFNYYGSTFGQMQELNAIRSDSYWDIPKSYDVFFLRGGVILNKPNPIIDVAIIAGLGASKEKVAGTAEIRFTWVNILSSSVGVGPEGSLFYTAGFRIPMNKFTPNKKKKEKFNPQEIKYYGDSKHFHFETTYCECTIEEGSLHQHKRTVDCNDKHVKNEDIE